MASVARLATNAGRAASFGPAKRILGLPVSRICSSGTCRPPTLVSSPTACRVSSWRGFTASGLRRQEEQGGQPMSSKEPQKPVDGKSEPLRILYCGSDDFSIPPLEALWSEHRRNPKGVEKIQVLVRPGKPTGRGYKTIREPPLKEVAKKLGLEVIERDTFTGWQMPPDINLIVAVSFGLKVPKRLLTQAQYGGLNLHPSMLPDLRGPAPLHHALLLRRETTGVTLQTLHPTEFDRGEILAQTPRGDQWRIPPDATVPTMVRALSGIGAEMLVDSLRKGLHTGQAGAKGRGWLDLGAARAPPPLAVAPKITTEDRRLVPLDGGFPELDVDDVAVRQRVIGPLWFVTHAGAQRVIIDEASLEPMPPFVAAMPRLGVPNEPCWAPLSDDETAAAPPGEPEKVWPPRRVWFHRCKALAKTDEQSRQHDVWFFTTERGHVYLMETPKQAAPGLSLAVGLRIQKLKIAGSPSGRAHTILKQLPVSDEGLKETHGQYAGTFERRLLPTKRAISPVRPKYEYVPIREEDS